MTNKILHYLVAGLAVIATDTAGQAEVAVAGAGCSRVCAREMMQTSMAAQIKALVTGDPERLERAKAAAL